MKGSIIMFEFLFGSAKKNPPKDVRLNEIYEKLKDFYKVKDISSERKALLRNTVKDYGYLTYPYIKAIEELTPAEIIYALQFKWAANGVLKEDKFSFENDKISVLARNNVKNSDWIKKEGHDIKLVNLAGLKDGNKTKEAGKFIDWLRQLLILPTGNLDNNIFNTTMYLIPFHPREFGCAYLPKSSEISENLFDKELEELTGMDAKEQVQTFIMLSQLAGHPVIYDILPQTGRFSKSVLANPEIARWYDINELIENVNKKIEITADELLKVHDADDVEIVKELYKQGLNGSSGDLSEHYKTIYDDFDNRMNVFKVEFSNAMLVKNSQIKLQKRVKEIVAQKLDLKSNKKLNENDITKQIDIIQTLIEKGLWPAPGGAWCSSGIPIFDKMSEGKDYPVFKHYDYKGEDVTCFANLDCQTPYYFVHLENGTYNQPVIDYFVNYIGDIQSEYNFDGFRVDHIDHIVDAVSEKDGKPISYRAPRHVLNKLNTSLKNKIPYFGTLAEYMLWDDLLKEYHQDMNFDLLWGNDIVSQCSKTPECIIEDNCHLTNYNVNYKQGEKLSILKTYNNQDGEFRCIDQYPGQLGKDGALYKWFKYKFLPGGKFAQRPMLYVDGDESFTKRGIECVIGDEVAMTRENHEDFYKKFDAIDRFVKSQNIITDGEAQIIIQDDDGFTAWLITKEPLKQAFLVISNYKCPTEKITDNDDEGNSYTEIREGQPVINKTLHLPVDYKISYEYKFVDKSFKKQPVTNSENTLVVEELAPAEFKIYGIEKL